MRIDNFNPVSISGQANFGGAGEDITNNSISSVTIRDLPGAGSFSYRCYMPAAGRPDWCVGSPVSAPTNATAVIAGDGLVTPEQTIFAFNRYENRSFSDANIVDLCTIFDTRYSEPIPFDGTNVAECNENCGQLGVDHIIEYNNTYADTSWRDVDTMPPSALSEECSAPSGWTSDVSVARANGPITKIRMRRLTPLRAGGNTNLFIHMSAHDNDRLAGVPNETLVRTWGVYRSDTDDVAGDAYRDCNYRSGAYPTPSHRSNGCGDRVALTRGLVRIDKTTLPGDTINALEAGSTIDFALSPTFSTVGANFSEDLIITDQLPANASYVPGSATQGGSAFDPVVSGFPATGQTLTWTINAQAANTTITPIQYSMTTPNNTPSGTILTNVVLIESPADASQETARQDQRSITVTKPRSMLMSKSVSVGTVDKNMPLTYTIGYENATDRPFAQIDTIDILPFVGDARIPATSFSGNIAFDGVTTQSGAAQFYVTADLPASIAPDPQSSSNDLVTGSTAWCPMTSSHTINGSASPSSGSTSGNCPISAADVTAVRLIDTQALAQEQARSFTVTITPTGNTGGDVYTNQAQGTSDVIFLSPTSPFVSTTVTGQGVLQARKTVSMQDLTFANGHAVPGAEVVYAIEIENTGDGPIDSDSIFLVDDFPPELEFWNGDIGAGGPVQFAQTTGNGVTFDATRDVRFSTANSRPTQFSECSDIAVNDAFLTDIKFVCFNPKGSLNFGDPNPEISLSFRARIK